MSDKNSISNNRTSDKENMYANISESDRQKLTDLEQSILDASGEKIALVAYHI